eukprot:COSAG06_NODE_35687_length_456_cov_7.691877_1_plen_60_part_10
MYPGFRSLHERTRAGHGRERDDRRAAGRALGGRAEPGHGRRAASTVAAAGSRAASYLGTG